MSPELLSGLVTVAVALVGTGGIYFANRFQKGTRENKLIDQLQEQMRDVLKRLDRSEARDRVYIPFILKQQHHIEQGLGPPAPPIPQVILDFLNNE